MHSSTLFALSLAGVAIASGPGDGPAPTPAPIVEREPVLNQRATTITQCNANNCLRVMTNTPAAASAFCSTYLQATTIVTVTPTVTVSGTSTSVPSTTSAPAFVPSHISSQCVLSTATSTPLPIRLSSACSCLHVTPATGTVTVTTYAPATTTTLGAASPECTGLSNPYIADGKSFDLYCGHAAFGSGNCLSSSDPGAASFEACVDACATIDGCVGVDFAKDWTGPGQNCCEPLESFDGGSYPMYDFAALSSLGYTPAFFGL